MSKVNRREFVAGAVASLTLLSVGRAMQPQRVSMKHLYQNCEGEMVAANSIEDASRHYDCELAGLSEPEDGWSQIPDTAKVAIFDEDSGGTITKTAAEWASECDQPVLVATTYW